MREYISTLFFGDIFMAKADETQKLFGIYNDKDELKKLHTYIKSYRVAESELNDAKEKLGADLKDIESSVKETFGISAGTFKQVLKEISISEEEKSVIEEQQGVVEDIAKDYPF